MRHQGTVEVDICYYKIHVILERERSHLLKLIKLMVQRFSHHWKWYKNSHYSTCILYVTVWCLVVIPGCQQVKVKGYHQGHTGQGWHGTKSWERRSTCKITSTWMSCHTTGAYHYYGMINYLKTTKICKKHLFIHNHISSWHDYAQIRCN